MRICKYIADFAYFDKKAGGWITEDVKGARRGQAYALFSLKRKLVKAIHGVEIVEV